MSDFTLTIDGQGVPSDASFGVINPARGEVFADCPDCSRSQLDDAMESAAAAFLGWRTDESVRRNMLLKCAEALQGRAEELGAVLTQEQGKPLAKAIEEVYGGAAWFQATSALELPFEVLQDDDEKRVELHRKPLGVVGAITPWNFPVLLSIWKIAPALLAGNTVVLKPSPFTPLSSLKMGEILRDVLPPGVLNVVSGGDALGAWITDHPTPRKISFTGSVATGKKILAAAAPDLKRVTLELGGNDPAIVLPDVDPKAIAERLFWGAFNNCGQICIAIKRIYAHEDVYQPLLNELTVLAKRAQVGDGAVAGTEIGPLNNRPQFERVQELIQAARDEGGVVLTGGEPLSGGGFFIPPTLVTELSDGSRLVDEEQFGPALPIMPYRDLDDAMARANATHFGLGGSIWTGNTERGAELARELECGTGWVNQHGALSPTAPFGGSKWSGIGYENGPWGLSAFTDLQVIAIAKN